MYKNNKTSIIGIAVTILILIIVVFCTNVKVSKLSYVENVFNKLVMPIQNGMTYLKNKFSGNDGFFADISALKEENDRLKAQVQELQKKESELELIKNENRTLKEYLELSETYSSYETIPANVINRDISNYSAVIAINVGKNDGIEENMTVIGKDGLVGHVISVTSSTAKVQTIIDISSSTSALLSNSRDAIVCKGTLDEKYYLKATYIPIEINLIESDIIETSGIGGIYPKGIKIGKITEIVHAKNITNRYAIIEPLVDFEKLETVLVIKNKFEE